MGTWLDGKEYPNTSFYDCRPKSQLHGVWWSIHSKADENGRCEWCGSRIVSRDGE